LRNFVSVVARLPLVLRGSDVFAQQKLAVSKIQEEDTFYFRPKTNRVVERFWKTRPVWGRDKNRITEQLNSKSSVTRYSIFIIF